MPPSFSQESPNRTLQQQFSDAVTALNRVDEPWVSFSYLVGATLPSGRPIFKSSTTDDSQPNPADDVISAFNNLSDNVRKAALISRNEHLDEVPTRHVKYLLVPFLTAKALNSWQGDPSIRLKNLKNSKQELSTFLTTCDDLRLLSEIDRERILNDSPDAVLSLTPEQKREQKIERFKAERASEKKLVALVERIQAGGNTGDDDDEDDNEREAALTILQSAVRQALKLHDEIDEEMELLRYAEKMRERGVDPSVHAQRTRPKGPPPGSNGMPSSFRIISNREQEREKVFRPGHSLPTYTVEEWGEIETKQMMEQAMKEKEKEIAAKRKKDEEDSDGDEVVDRETIEARRWDNWKDDNNKGSGNTIR